MNENDWRLGAIERLDRAAASHCVTVESLLKSAEFIAACTSYGLKPEDVLLNGVRAYPHLMQLMGRVWDMRSAPEELDAMVET